MSTQIVQLPAQAGASPVARLGRASEQPTRTARAVQQTRFLAGQLQFQSRFLEQHVEVGSVSPGMVQALRDGLGQLELQLEGLVEELGAQHVELSELTDLLDAVLDRQGHDEAAHTAGVGRWSA